MDNVNHSICLNFLSFDLLGNLELIWCPTFKHCENFIPCFPVYFSCSPILLFFFIFFHFVFYIFFQLSWQSSIICSSPYNLGEEFSGMP